MFFFLFIERRNASLARFCSSVSSPSGACPPSGACSSSPGYMATSHSSYPILGLPHRSHVDLSSSSPRESSLESPVAILRQARMYSLMRVCSMLLSMATSMYNQAIATYVARYIC